MGKLTREDVTMVETIMSSCGLSAILSLFKSRMTSSLETDFEAVKLMFGGKMVWFCISYALMANLMNCSLVMLKASSVFTSYQIYSNFTCKTYS